MQGRKADARGVTEAQGVAPPRRRPAATRDAIAHAFLSEYHRLLAELLTADPADVGEPGAPDRSAHQRAFAWRVTAARIPLVPERCWPTWLLAHLRTAAETPGIGPEYERQRRLLVQLLGSGELGTEATTQRG